MRTNIIVTRMGIYFRGELATEEWLAKRLKMVKVIGMPAFERLHTDWNWVWQVAPECMDQVKESAPDYVHLVEQTPAEKAEHDRDYHDGQIELPTVDDIPGDRFLVVRLDSDDAYLPNVLDSTAQKEWDENSLIDWASGWRWDIRTNRLAEIEWPDYKQGHFLAVTQESRDRMLDFGGDHTKVRRVSGRTHIPIRKYHHWIQVIHGGNVWGKWRQAEHIPGISRKVLSRFGINEAEVLSLAKG